MGEGVFGKTTGLSRGNTGRSARGGQGGGGAGEVYESGRRARGREAPLISGADSVLQFEGRRAPEAGRARASPAKGRARVAVPGFEGKAGAAEQAKEGVNTAVETVKRALRAGAVAPEGRGGDFAVGVDGAALALGELEGGDAGGAEKGGGAGGALGRTGEALPVEVGLELIFCAADAVGGREGFA